jgi:TubC N-terminal docking domain
MLVGELLCRIEEQGVTLKCECSEDRLHYAPPGALPADLLAELKARKEEVIRILREDDESQRTGIIQSERQVFDLAREYFKKEAGQCDEPANRDDSKTLR